MLQLLLTVFSISLPTATTDECLEGALAPPPGETAIDFGADVAADGSWVLVGDPKDASMALEAGVVHVFRREASDTLPVYTSTLHGSGGAPSAFERFGTAVAVSGDRVAVGAPGFLGTQPALGGVFIFEHDSGSWIESQRIEAPGGWSEFGLALDLDGDRLLVGSKGRASVYEFDGAAWVLDEELVPAPSAAPCFGRAVALDGDRAVIGNPCSGYFFNGTIALYEQIGGAWTFQDSSSGPMGDDVAIEGDLVVGGNRSASSPTSPGVAGGSVFIFRVESGALGDPKEISADDPVAGDDFGSSVALEDGVLLVGAPYSDPAGFSSGSAYVFEEVGPRWVQRSIVVPTDTADLQFAGDSVALADGLAFVGAPGSDLGTPNGGAALAVKVVDDDPLWGCPPSLSLSTGGAQSLVLRAPPSADGQVYFVLGSASGTTPGVPLDNVLLPLTVDGYLTATLTQPNSGPLTETFGFLDASGYAEASIVVPPHSPGSLAGLTLHHAFCTLPLSLELGPVTFASNAVALTFTD